MRKLVCLKDFLKGQSLLGGLIILCISIIFVFQSHKVIESDSAPISLSTPKGSHSNALVLPASGVTDDIYIVKCNETGAQGKAAWAEDEPISFVAYDSVPNLKTVFSIGNSNGTFMGLLQSGLFLDIPPPLNSAS